MYKHKKSSAFISALAGMLCLALLGACSSAVAKSPADHQNRDLNTRINQENHDLELVVSLDEPVYKIGEHIKPTVRIANMAALGDSYLINARLLIANDIHFIILDQDGNKVKWKLGNPTWPPLRAHDFTNLCSLCEFRRTYFSLEHYYELSQRGDYTIQVKYTNESDPEDGEVAWHGTLMSNIVDFSIIP